MIKNYETGIEAISSHKKPSEVIERYMPEVYERMCQLAIDILDDSAEYETWEWLVIALSSGSVCVICYDIVSGEVMSRDTMDDFVSESIEYIEEDMEWHRPYGKYSL